MTLIDLRRWSTARSRTTTPSDDRAGRRLAVYNAADVRRRQPPLDRGAVPTRVSPRCHSPAHHGGVSTAVFYVLAVLIVLAALAAVVSPSTRVVLLAVMTGDLLVGILLIASGAYLLGAIALVLPAGCLLVVASLLRRSGYAALLADIPGRASSWPLAAGVCAGIGVLLFWTTATRVEDTAASGGGQSLLTVLHYRTPIALGVAAVLAIVSVGGALMIGRTGDDERVLDRAAEQRRLREQRAQLRRDHRAAARALREGRGRTPS
jgi:hypothetical protein